MESRLSIMERAKRDDGGSGGGRSGGARGGGKKAGDYCVRMRGLPWEATKVRRELYSVINNVAARAVLMSPLDGAARSVLLHQ